MPNLNLKLFGSPMRFIALLLATIFSFTNSAFAEDENPMGISLYGSFLHTERVPNALFFFDKIKDGDSFELRKALRDHGIEIVVLSSPGGSVYEGLTMAGILHDKKLTTYIPKKNLFTDGQGDCASACAYMYFAGSTRVADGKLGVHQFASSDANEKASISEIQESAQTIVSDIAGLLGDFDVPTFVYPKMFQSREMYYFNKREMIEIERINRNISKDQINDIDFFIDKLIEMIESAEAEQTIDETRNNWEFLSSDDYLNLVGTWYYDPSIIAVGTIRCTPSSSEFNLGKQLRKNTFELSTEGLTFLKLNKDLIHGSIDCVEGGTFMFVQGYTENSNERALFSGSKLLFRGKWSLDGELHEHEIQFSRFPSDTHFPSVPNKIFKYWHEGEWTIRLPLEANCELQSEKVRLEPKNGILKSTGLNLVEIRQDGKVARLILPCKNGDMFSLRSDAQLLSDGWIKLNSITNDKMFAVLELEDKRRRPRPRPTSFD